MKSSKVSSYSEWGVKSITYWLSLLCSIGLIGLGVNGMIQPQIASTAFGLGIADPLDSGFARVKFARDLVFGLGIGIFFLLKMQRSLYIMALLGASIAMIDGILVLTQAGGQAKDSWQHVITMAVVLFIAFLLKRDMRKRAIQAEAEAAPYGGDRNSQEY